MRKSQSAINPLSSQPLLLAIIPKLDAALFSKGRGFRPEESSAPTPAGTGKEIPCPEVSQQSPHHTAWVTLGSSNSALSSILRSIKQHPLLQQTEGWRGMGLNYSKNICCSGKSSRNFRPQAKCWFHPLPLQSPLSRVRASRALHRHPLAGEAHYVPKINTFKIKITNIASHYQTWHLIKCLENSGGKSPELKSWPRTFNTESMCGCRAWRAIGIFSPASPECDFRWETPLPGMSLLQKYSGGCLKSLAVST